MRTIVAAIVLCACLPLHAAPVAPGADHPILGIWKLQLPDQDCTETYRFRADGTTLVLSAEEVSESEFVIDPKPGVDGFYKFSDRVTKQNGRPDCGGAVMKVGTSSVNYVRFNPDRTVFVMCRAASLDACIGPFRRVSGQDI